MSQNWEEEYTLQYWSNNLFSMLSKEVDILTQSAMTGS